MVYDYIKIKLTTIKLRKIINAFKNLTNILEIKKIRIVYQSLIE